MTALAYTTRSDDSMFLAADEVYGDVKEWLTGVETGRRGPDPPTRTGPAVVIDVVYDGTPGIWTQKQSIS